MSDLGPGPRRWKRAKDAYEAGIEQRNRDIARALKQRLGTGQEIADAYELDRAYLYKLGLNEEDAEGNG